MSQTYLDRSLPPTTGDRARLVKNGDSPAHCIGEVSGAIEVVAGNVWIRLDDPYCGTSLLGPCRLSWLAPEVSA